MDGSSHTSVQNAILDARDRILLEAGGLFGCVLEMEIASIAMNLLKYGKNEPLRASSLNKVCIYVFMYLCVYVFMLVMLSYELYALHGYLSISLSLYLYASCHGYRIEISKASPLLSTATPECALERCCWSGLLPSYIPECTVSLASNIIFFRLTCLYPPLRHHNIAKTLHHNHDTHHDDHRFQRNSAMKATTSTFLSP